MHSWNWNLLLQTRKNYLAVLEELSINEVNTIPIGFNNNMIWNIAHIIATMDILFYKLNGLETHLDSEFIEAYRKGTAPQAFVNADMVKSIKRNLLNQLEWIKKDMEAGVFPSQLAKSYTTSYNFELATLEDIFNFNQVHEALHMGIVMSLRKFV
jgi:hypothetical protein